MSNPYQSPDQHTDQDTGRNRPVWVKVVFGLSLLGLGMILFLGLFTARTVQVMGPAPTVTPVVNQSSDPQLTVEHRQPQAEAADEASRAEADSAEDDAEQP